MFRSRKWPKEGARHRPPSAPALPRPAPVLRGRRVLLTLAHPEDAPALLAFHLRNQDHLAPWLPVPPDTFWRLGFWRSWTRASRPFFARDQAVRLVLRWARRKDRTVIGQINLGQVVRGAIQSAELSYQLDAGLQGRGLMREALQLVIAYAFGPMGLHRLVANHLPENERSSRLLARLGFELLGYSPSHMQIAGAWRDHVLTALVNPNG